jgi:ribosomal-protein-alanine N-acetyltransferase
MQPVLIIEALSFRNPWVEEMFLAEIDDTTGVSHAVVAEEGRRVVGYATYRVVFDDAHLMNIAIGPAFRNQGRGRKLLRWVMDQCARLKARTMFLEVRPSNHAARKVYEEFGFKVIDVRRKYYHDGEDALVMETSLPPASASGEARA